MANYYNEIEPFAAEWLRELMKKGLIPNGEVDTRSIIDVQPEDLRGFSQHHFFAGIGGWSYALRLAGWPEDRPIFTGSCPCQPFSVAGKGKGTADERHLWPHFFRLIRACKPEVVMGEQVAGKAGYGWLDGVRSDLEAEGYACDGVDIPACAVNAPHIRSRLYWVAHTNGELHDGRGDIGQRRRDEHSDGGSSRDMANAESVGRRGRAHDEDEGRREQPFADTCTGGGDMADADMQRQRDIPDSRKCGERSRPQEYDKQYRGGCFHDMADADDAGREGRSILPERAGECSAWSDGVEWRRGADGKTRRVKSGVRLLVDGVPGRVGRLRGFGNAIVPPLAAEVIKAFMET